MNRVELTHTLIEFDGIVRIERGPRRIKAIATESLLLTIASHYRSGEFDALGNKITLGHEMEYLDWFGEHIWYVYKLNSETSIWEHIGDSSNQNDAEELALGLI